MVHFVGAGSGAPDLITPVSYTHLVGGMREMEKSKVKRGAGIFGEVDPVSYTHLLCICTCLGGRNAADDLGVSEGTGKRKGRSQIIPDALVSGGFDGNDGYGSVSVLYGRKILWLDCGGVCSICDL